ncbi:MAG TPA: hypothetical protein VF435_18360, partial [Pyrinomonadaceae bacterium]
GDRDQMERRARQAEKTNVRRPGRPLTSMDHFTGVDKGVPLATIRSLFVIFVYVKQTGYRPLSQ